jgi:hypothetical protein
MSRTSSSKRDSTRVLVKATKRRESGSITDPSSKAIIPPTTPPISRTEDPEPGLDTKPPSVRQDRSKRPCITALEIAGLAPSSPRHLQPELCTKTPHKTDSATTVSSESHHTPQHTPGETACDVFPDQSPLTQTIMSLSCHASQPAIQAHYLNQRRSLMDDWESTIITTTTTQAPSDHDTLSTTMHTGDIAVENPTHRVASSFLLFSFHLLLSTHGCQKSGVLISGIPGKFWGVTRIRIIV